MHFAAPLPRWLAPFAAALVGVATLAAGAALASAYWRAGALALAALVCAAALAWATIAPSADRRWAADVARAGLISIEGEAVVVDNVRVFRWTGPESAEPHWETRRYDLAQIEGADVFLSHWSSPAIAHMFVSFRFAGARPLALSVEIRKEEGEEFSAFAGFFKRYEVVLIAADEGDIVKVRTNVRNEDVYLYRADIQAATARRLFEHYAAYSRRLAGRPAFYNTLTTNCTTTPYLLARATGEGLPFDWRVLVSGYADAYLYDRGFLDRSLPFPETKRRAAISARARAAPSDEAFPGWIRGAAAP
ncbi:MAG: DUF4105 domain-containing protein [Rhizobiales bacterium]|nr:DUF4105 domain-containing protein [Hyphomicrobiales bacterium]